MFLLESKFKVFLQGLLRALLFQRAQSALVHMGLLLVPWDALNKSTGDNSARF